MTDLDSPVLNFVPQSLDCGGAGGATGAVATATGAAGAGVVGAEGVLTTAGEAGAGAGVQGLRTPRMEVMTKGPADSPTRGGPAAWPAECGTFWILPALTALVVAACRLCALRALALLSALPIEDPTLAPAAVELACTIAPSTTA